MTRTSSRCKRQKRSKKLLWKLNWRMFPRLSQYGCFRLQVSFQVLPSPSGSPSMLSQAYELLQHTATTGAHWDFENLATSVSQIGSKCHVFPFQFSSVPLAFPQVPDLLDTSRGTPPVSLPINHPNPLFPFWLLPACLPISCLCKLRLFKDNGTSHPYS